jgi:hypothetical protein
MSGMRAELLDGLPAVRGLRDDLHVRLTGHERGDPAAQHGVIVDGEDMRPGMTAIIVEADEKSTRPVDNIVALGGGHVYRQAA